MNNEASTVPPVTESPAELGRELTALANMMNSGQPVGYDLIWSTLCKMMASEGATATDALALAVTAQTLSWAQAPKHDEGGALSQEHVLGLLLDRVVDVLAVLSGTSPETFKVGPRIVN